MKASALFVAVLVSFGASASGYTAYCGPYTITAKVGEMDMVNGERVTSEKITNLGSDGLKVDMGLMPARDGNNYGFEYIHHPGSDKRFLNVQLLQNGMDAPKVIGSFPCKRVMD